MPRPVADDCRRIEARQVPAPGGCVGLRWGDIATATLARDEDVVTVSYRWRNEPGESWHETAADHPGLPTSPAISGATRRSLSALAASAARAKLYHHPAGSNWFSCQLCCGLVPWSHTQGFM